MLLFWEIMHKKTSDLQLNLAKVIFPMYFIQLFPRKRRDYLERIQIFVWNLSLYYGYNYILFFSELLIRTIFGEKWLGMVPFFDILLISSLILFVDSMIRMVYKIVDRTKLLLLNEIIKVIFLLSLLAIGLSLSLDLSAILWLLLIG